MLIDPKPHAVKELELDGRKPFSDWLRRLKDKQAKASILARLDRIAEAGNFGDYRHLNNDVFELRIHIGPGYRIYFGLVPNQVVLLLWGGGKSSQARDIAKAKNLWKLYQQR